MPQTLQTVSLRPPRPPVHAHTQPRERGHRALVEMMGLRLAPLDQVASMRHLRSTNSSATVRCSTFPMPHLPSALRSRGTQNQKMAAPWPNGPLQVRHQRGTRDLGGSILPPNAKSCETLNLSRNVKFMLIARSKRCYNMKLTGCCLTLIVSSNVLITR